ncbi:MAG: sodium-dependent transporter [Bacteroidales bacterium]|jgi:NSS family neurotransmitter:Na+ symporter|nr:sodium-dependent transporter [Bacteroidales bacterium]
MQRDGFGSRLGALMALVGSAVGLGNLWKFPYMAGKYGGAAFIIVYIGFMFIFCLPLMLSEFIIGRRSQSNAVGAFKKLAPSTPWFLTGVVGVLTAFLILSFYSVVGGWTIKYFATYIFSGFDEGACAGNMFYEFTQSSIQPIVTHLIFLGITIAILWMGVKNGIEKYSKILMPALFLMILILTFYSISLPNSGEGIRFLLLPDFSKLTPEALLNALGQGLFSLSLGMGTVITYSSYMKKTERLGKIAILTIMMDLIFALLAGFVILPAVFSFGSQPDQGPTLLFDILPQIFAQMSFGGIFAVLFFVILIIAALTSSISLLEVIVAYLSEERKIPRKKALIISGVALAVLGSLCSLSFGLLKDFTILQNTIFDLFDKLSSTYMMPIGALLISLFVGWKMKKKEVYDEMSNSKSIKVRGFNILLFLIRYIVPVGIVIIFLNLLGVFDKLF